MIMLMFNTEEDKNKFTYVFDTYKKYVMYTIKLFIKDQFINEDLLQETFVIIADNLNKIDLEDEIRTRNYIITITRNYCKNYLRKQNKIKEEFLEDSADIGYIKESPLDLIVKEESYSRLKEEIRNLDDKYRMVFELKYINNFDDEEIAKYLNITKKNAQMRLYRAKLMLREKLGEIYHA